MSKNTEQIRVGADGAFSVAPDGTSLPEDLNPLGGAYTELGYFSEDGVTMTKGRTVEGVPAWPSPVDVRKLVSTEAFSLAGELLQWNSDTLTTAYGGGEISEVGDDVYRYDPPDPADGLPMQVAVLDWEDGPHMYRVVVAKASAAEDAETQIVRTAAAGLPLTLEANAGDDGVTWYLLTNDPAFAPTGS